MAQTKAQLVGGIGISTVSDLNVYGGLNATGIITATSFVGSIAGTAATFTNNVTVGSAVTINSGGVNVAGVVTATSFVGNGSGLTGAGSTVADDTVTNETFYPVFTQTTSGTITASKVSTTKLSFNPSTGTLSASNVSIAGTLTYEDVTNVDSVGLITARSGIRLTGGDATLGTGVTVSGSTANTFTVSTNGSERVRVDSSGNLGIGNPTPGATLDVSGDIRLSAGDPEIEFNNGGSRLRGHANALSIHTGGGFGSSASEAVRINNTGVGIGTASPNEKLTIASSSSASYIQICDSSTGTTSGDGLFFGSFNGAAEIKTKENNVLQFGTNNTERARISAAGGFSVGTTADPGAGAIYATGNVTAYYSDDRLKTRLGNIENAIEKVCALTGFYYEANETAQELGYQVKKEVGVSAQDVEKVLPEIVTAAPIDEQYKTIHYERLVPLLIEAIKEQQEQIKNQQEQIDALRAQMESK